MGQVTCYGCGGSRGKFRETVGWGGHPSQVWESCSWCGGTGSVYQIDPPVTFPDPVGRKSGSGGGKGRGGDDKEGGGERGGDIAGADRGSAVARSRPPATLKSVGEFCNVFLAMGVTSWAIYAATGEGQNADVAGWVWILGWLLGVIVVWIVLKPFAKMTGALLVASMIAGICYVVIRFIQMQQ